MRCDAMRDDTIHPSDQDLLLVADSELPEQRGAEVRAHLGTCWQCRARMAEIERTIVDFVRAHANAAEYSLPPAAGPRARLKARMEELAEGSSRTRWPVLRCLVDGPNLAYACVLLVVFVLAARMLYQQKVTRQSSAVAYGELLPNPQLTPGATRNVAIRELCSAAHDEVVRSVSNTLQQQVLTEYGVPDTRASDYEVDYLITPGLGGKEDIRNLWPEPHYDATWNSYVKDQLEERLHDMVCTGQLDLATAQRQIASNWIVAYKKYFATEHPLARHGYPLAQASLGRAVRTPRS
jgi:anti-sigma factor RsiW